MRKLKCLATRIFGLHINNDSIRTSSKQDHPVPPPQQPPPPSATSRSISPTETSSSNLSAIAAVCGCGRPLESGWDCPTCRSVCPQCGRALALNEECGRCIAKQSSLHNHNNNNPMTTNNIINLATIQRS